MHRRALRALDGVRHVRLAEVCLPYWASADGRARLGVLLLLRVLDRDGKAAQLALLLPAATHEFFRPGFFFT